MNFTEKDLQQLHQKGISKEVIEQQIEQFKKGFPYIKLYAPATPLHGLHSFKEGEIASLSSYFTENKSDYEILKFIPASGVASRMFKHLLAFKNTFQGSPGEITQLKSETDFNSVGYFFKNLKKFAFYEALKIVIKKNNFDLEELLMQNNYNEILDFLLTEKGLNYSQQPKALLFFHNYPEGPRCSFEEHLIEAAHYALDKNRIARVHFTVSTEHQPEFEKVFEGLKGKYEEKFNITFDIGFSQQKPSTDTIAVDLNNEPLREEDGTLTFRPGGHGALIENLNELGSEIIFIKNIDNVVPDRLRGITYLYKKVIGGLMFQLQEKTFEYLDLLDDGNVSETELEGIKTFALEKLNIFIPLAYEAYDKMARMDFLFNKLNRPVRVAGMVKNEGEPGGGPFWISDEDGELSLQIVESSQINSNDPGQKKIVSSATHFNPVDLVCGLRNFHGEKFDLHNFVDPTTGFISQKSSNGRDIKIQELPGLWNGAMANWITVFVEVPIITFNPVKTVNDLLRPQHQPE